MKKTTLPLAIALLVASLGLNAVAAAKPRDPKLVKEQYETVLARLDAGGDLLIFANVDGLLEETLQNFIDILALAPQKDADTKQLNDMLAKVPGFLKKNGFYAVEGIGFSSIPRTDGLYDTKMFVSRKAEAANLPLWTSMVGLQQKRLNSLDFLPKDTVMAQATANDLKQTWKLVREGLKELASQKTIDGFEAGLAAGAAAIGMDIDALIATLGDENFFSIQLSSETTIALPSGPGGEMLSIPSPSLLIGLAVKDDTLLKVLETSIANTGMPVQKTSVGDTVLQTLNLPVPSPVPVSLTFASHKGMFLLGSTPQVVTEAIKAYTEKNGLLADAAFKKAFEGLPLTNNGISYVSERFGKTIADIQSKALSASAAKQDPQALAMIEKMSTFQSFGPSASVTLNWKSGVLTQGVGSAGGRQFVLSTAIAPIGLLSAIAIPSFVKARTVSQQNACINNLRQLDGAKEQSAMANRWTDGKTIAAGSEDEKKVLEYIKGGTMPVCPQGGTYTLNAIGEAPACSNPAHTMPW